MCICVNERGLIYHKENIKRPRRYLLVRPKMFSVQIRGPEHINLLAAMSDTFRMCQHRIYMGHWVGHYIKPNDDNSVKRVFK